KGKLLYGATVAVPLYEVNRNDYRDLIVGSLPKVREYYYNWNLSRGVLLAPIDYVKLEKRIWGGLPKEVDVEIYASSTPRPEAWLNREKQPPRAENPAFKPYLTLTVPWKLYNENWRLFVYTLPVFEAGSPRYMAHVTLVAGAAMTLLATV